MLINKKNTYILWLLFGTIFLLINLYSDYYNIKTYKKLYERQINNFMEFDKTRRGLIISFESIKLDVYDDNFSYCNSTDINSELENIVTPNDFKIKLLITKDKNSNLFKTIINDTCYKFRVYADNGLFGKLFE